MIEAYAIAVTLALKGNIAGEIGIVAKQFETLNKIIGSSQIAVNELAAGMRGLQRVGQSAATAWTQAARAMEKAAAAAKAAGGALNGGGAGSGAGKAAGGAAMAAASAAGAGGGAQIPRNRALTLLGPRNLAIGGGAAGGGAGGGSGGGLVPFEAAAAGGAAGGGAGGIPLGMGRTMPGMPSQSDLAMAAGGFGLLGVGLLKLVEDAVKATAEVKALQSTLGLMGFSTQQTNEALKLATNLQQTVPGSTIHGGLDIIKDIFTVTQNKQDALDESLIRGFSQASIILGSVGKRQALPELYKAMQAGELRGAFSGDNGEPDPAKAAEFLRKVITTTIQTGGRIGPTEIFQVLKSGGLGGAMMDDKTLFADMIAPMISMGAPRAGTGIQAFASQFSAGKMSDAAVKLMARMHLFENLPADVSSDPLAQYSYLKDNYKTGIGQYAIPMNLMPYRNNPELNPSQHPIEFMLKILEPVIDRYNLEVNGPPRNAEDLKAQRLSQALALSSRIPAGNEMGDVFRNMALILRDREAILAGDVRNQGDAVFRKQQETNPEIAMKAFPAAINGLMVALGGPIMDGAIAMIRDITGVLNKLSDFARENPTLTKNIMETVFVIGAFSAAMAVLSGVFLVFGPMVTVLSAMATGVGTLGGALTLFAVGTPAGLALTAIVVGLTGLAAALTFLAPSAEKFKAGSAASEGLKQAQRQGAQGMGNIPTDGFGVDGMPIARPQSYAPPAPANGNRTTPIVFHLDGREVARGLLPHIGNEVDRAPTGRTGFDPRVSPRFGGAVFAA